MFKNRVFMMGLGIGLMIGAILLQVMSVGQNEKGGLWTREQVENAASILNLKVVEQEAELLTEEEWEQKTKTANNQGEGTASVSETKQPANPEQPGVPNINPPAEGDIMSQQPASPTPPTNAEESTSTAPEEPNPPQSDKVEYKVTYGSTLTTIAEELKQAGVISDQAAFIKEARAKKAATKIRTGTYQFTIGEEFNSIINKLTEKPKLK